MTDGFRLPARYILHMVGPKNGESPTLLQFCYVRALDKAVTLGAKSIAFPCISTGAWGFDPHVAASTALGTVKRWLASRDNQSKLDRIVFALNAQGEEELYHSFGLRSSRLQGNQTRA